MVSASDVELMHEIEEQIDEGVIEGSTGLPLGQWVSTLRRSRKITGQDPAHDIQENPNEVRSMIMLHVSSNSAKSDFSRLNDGA